MSPAEQHAFTQAWWRRTLAQPDKLKAWLQKLHRTELGGYQDHLRFMADQAGQLTSRQRTILNNIAEDELKHAIMLSDLMTGRHIPLQPQGEPSTYWDTMLAQAKTFSAYCAANYYGEALAAYRFGVMLNMPETPPDIRAFLTAALPDETFHRETLQRMASVEDLAIYKVLHEHASASLREAKAA